MRLIGDRIEAGTYLLAAAASAGSVTAQGIDPLFFGKFLDLLYDLGLDVETSSDSVRVSRRGDLKAVNLATNPFPEIATDLQAPLMAALSLACGESRIEENVFEGRFGHASELCRMGAQIEISERAAIIRGVDKLSAAEVEGGDIRAAACLVIAGLAADGVTRIYEPSHIRRGYDSLEDKLRGLGATVAFRSSDIEDYSFAGC